MGKDKVVSHHRDVPYRVLERVHEKGVLNSHGSDCGSMVIHGESNELKVRELAKKQFDKMVNSDDIVLERAYSLPPAMAVRNPTTKYGRTPYEVECGDMNGLELRMADVLSNAEHVLWWHRVDERRKDAEFCVNGFISHYPDFIAMTVDGVLLAIETKGEQLKNDDGRDKLELGGTWALMAGKGFRYCMVFDHDAIADRNAYTFDEFRVEVLSKGV